MSLADKLKNNKLAAEPAKAQSSETNPSKPLVTENGGNASGEGSAMDLTKPQPSEGGMKQDDSDVIHADTLSQEQLQGLGELAEGPDEKPHKYSTPNSPTFSIHLSGGEVRSKNGVMALTEDQHREVQKLIKSGRPDIAQNMLYIDVKAAEEIARQHMERAAQLRQASKGATAAGGRAAASRAEAGEPVRNLDVQESAVISGQDGGEDPAQ